MNGLVGQQIDNYKVTAFIARGGMAEVYLAEDVNLQRPLALKVMLSDLAMDETAVARFQREARTVAQLDHPNIVRAYDVDSEKEGKLDIHFLVMEGVVSLQFEDIVSQLIEQIRHRSGMIERYLHGFAAIQRGALQNLEPAQINARVEQLVAHHQAAAADFLTLNDSAVQQDSVNEGNVDLF